MWSRRFEEREVAELVSLARVVFRLAVLFRSGVSARAAWREIADNADDEVRGPLGAIATALENGGRHAAVVERTCREESTQWRIVAAVVSVADEAGAPMAEALWECAESLSEEAVTRRELLALAEGPRLTIIILSALPLLGLAVAQLLGVGAIGLLMGTGFGRFLLIASFAAIALAVWWMRRMVKSSSPRGWSPSLARVLFSIATRGGGLPETASKGVERVMESLNLGVPGPDIDHLARLSRRVGIPVSRLAIEESRWARRERRLEAADAAARLQVMILIPLGTLVLPAFVALTVVPVAVSLLGSMVGATAVPW